jgi:hypothetical protein
MTSENGSFDNGGGLLFCRKCGNKLSTDAVFCEKCGEPVHAAAPAAPAQDQAPAPEPQTWQQPAQAQAPAPEAQPWQQPPQTWQQPAQQWQQQPWQQVPQYAAPAAPAQTGAGMKPWLVILLGALSGVVLVGVISVVVLLIING